MGTNCKGCPKLVNSTQILRHIAQSKKCRSHYSEDEIGELRGISISRKYARRKGSYDPCKRAKRYQNEKDIISEKNEAPEKYHKEKRARYYQSVKEKLQKTIPLKWL